MLIQSGSDKLEVQLNAGEGSNERCSIEGG